MGSEADSVLEIVRERVSLLPEGRQRLDGFAACRAVAERLGCGQKTVSLAASALLGLVFLAQFATDSLGDPFRLLAFGANSYPLVKNGELFRLATANILHGSLLHVTFNVLALVTLGMFLEPLLGAGRFLCILLASALAGATGSAFVGHHVLAVGASTGIAGLIGAHAVILWRWPERLPNPPTMGTWVWLAYALVGGGFFKNVDRIGHIAGFAAGLSLAYLMTRRTDLLELAARHRFLFRTAAVLLGAVFLTGGAIAALRASAPEHDVRVAATLMSDASLSSSMLNDLAWTVATGPVASPSDLDLALRGIQRAIERKPREAAFRDTQATVLYRLGRWQEAVRTEYDVVAGDRTPFHVSQLARFEWTLARANGRLLLGQPPKALPRAQITPGVSILVDLGEPRLPSGAVLHLVLASEEQASALLELTIGASESSGILRYTLPRDLSFPRPDEVSLALVDTRNIDEPPGETRWELQPIVPEVSRLP